MSTLFFSETIMSLDMNVYKYNNTHTYVDTIIVCNLLINLHFSISLVWLNDNVNELMKTSKLVIATLHRFIDKQNGFSLLLYSRDVN